MNTGSLVPCAHSFRGGLFPGSSLVPPLWELPVLWVRAHTPVLPGESDVWLWGCPACVFRAGVCLQACGSAVFCSSVCVAGTWGPTSVCCSQKCFQKLHSMAGWGGVCAWVCVCVPCGRGLRALGILCVHRDSTGKLFPCGVVGAGRWDRRPQGSISQGSKLRLQGHSVVRGAVGIQTKVCGTHRSPCSVPSTHLLLKCFLLENKDKDL